MEDTILKMAKTINCIRFEGWCSWGNCPQDEKDKALRQAKACYRVVEENNIILKTNFFGVLKTIYVKFNKIFNNMGYYILKKKGLPMDAFDMRSNTFWVGYVDHHSR